MSVCYFSQSFKLNRNIQVKNNKKTKRVGRRD